MRKVTQPISGRPETEILVLLIPKLVFVPCKHLQESLVELDEIAEINKPVYSAEASQMGDRTKVEEVPLPSGMLYEFARCNFPTGAVVEADGGKGNACGLGGSATKLSREGAGFGTLSSQASGMFSHSSFMFCSSQDLGEILHP